jgi:hypothetical protein
VEELAKIYDDAKPTPSDPAAAEAAATPWQDAAKRFRLPYWDWAAKDEDGTLAVPSIIVDEFFAIRKLSMAE